MRVLFDNGTPRGVPPALRRHSVDEARSQGWDRLRNGELLHAAEAAGFEVLVTTDRNSWRSRVYIRGFRYQQNLSSRKLAIVVLGNGRWKLIRKRLSEIAAAVDAATPGSYTEVDIPVE